MRISGIASIKCLKKLNQESIFSLSTIAYASSKILLFTSIVVANNNVWTNRPLRKVLSIAMNFQQKVKEVQETKAQINS